MEFRILGPLAVEEQGQPISVGGTRQRALLAILLLHRGEVVSADRVIEELYGDRAPAHASTSIRANVSRLRKALGRSELLRTHAGGYVLEPAPGSVDADRFERLVDEGRRLRAAGEPVRAAARFRKALELWRGPALSDLAYEDFAQPEIARLTERRIETIEERIAAELDLGRHAELVGELEHLVHELPVRERLCGQLMLALYRSGRQAEALEAFQDVRQKLVDELGIDPGTELRDLQGAILRHDPALDLAVPVGEVPPRFPAGLGALPAGLTRVLGRASEIDAICERLRGDVRILTLTGPGGIGKTRVAIEVAERLAPEYADGARFVALSSISDPELVGVTVATALGLHPDSGQTALEALVEELRDTQLVLVIDNYEHLLAAAPLASELASAARGLKILATSRAPLHIRGEHLWPLPPLQFPPDYNNDLESVAASPSIALFTERARAVEPSFTLDDSNAAAVVDICNRLDGLPLAIELAAARIQILPPDALAARLDRALPLLNAGPRDAPPRHQALNSTIAWSYGLLAEEHRGLFRRLSVFSGGWTIDAAEVVCGGDLASLAALVESSLIRDIQIDGHRRGTMLATIREFAHDRLVDAGEQDKLARTHAEYFLAVAEAQPRMRSAELVAELADEEGNFRAALSFAGGGSHPELMLRLAGALWRFWWVRDQDEEARMWLEEAYAHGSSAPGSLRAEVLRGLGVVVDGLGDPARGWELEEEALGLYREIGDPEGVGACLNNLGRFSLEQGDLERAILLLEDSIQCLEQLGAGQSLAPRNNLAEVLVRKGDFVRARELFEDVLAGAKRESNDLVVADIRLQLAWIYGFEGAFDKAGQLVGEVLPHYVRIGASLDSARCMFVAALVCAGRGRLDDAACLVGAASATRQRLGRPALLEDMYARPFQTLEQELGRERYATRYGLGAVMSFDDAIQLAQSVLA